MEPGSEVRKVTVIFGSTVALDDLSLQLGMGEAVILRGPSGCGKTTLLRVISGLTTPCKGEIWLQGLQASRSNCILPPPPA